MIIHCGLRTKLSCKVSSEAVALRENNPFNVRLEYANFCNYFS